MKKIIFHILVLFSMFVIPASIILGIGCAHDSGEQTKEPLYHSHYYPFTEVMGDYHLRLIVDHNEGNMALVFEDFAEQPVKPVSYESLTGEIIFPDGTVKKETFRAGNELCNRYCRRYYSRNFGFPRQQGVFTLKAEWIKDHPSFQLKVTVPFNNKNYELIFNYEIPGGKIPFHRK